MTPEHEDKSPNRRGKSFKLKKSPTQADKDKVTNVGHIFRPNIKEKESKLFHLRYSPQDDCYYQLGSNTAVVNGWKNGTNVTVNVTRRMGRRSDMDLQWAYLTRYPGRTSGSISWKFDFTDAGLVVDAVIALTFGRTVEGGHIRYDIISPEPCCEHRNPGDELSGLHTLLLLTYLDGDWDNQCQTQFLYQEWSATPRNQHSTQEKSHTDEALPFEIIIKLKFPDDKCICQHAEF